MYIDFTSKQYCLILRALAVMKPFYNNDFHAICKEVGEAYGVDEDAIMKACATLTAANVTAPVKEAYNNVSYTLAAIANDVEELNGDDTYKYRVDLDVPCWNTVADVLDAYSRILMGQFGIIFESLDIAASYDYGKLRLLRLQAYHDARWSGVGVIEARDLLIPQLKKMRVGWNGNFGISNSELAYNSKLSYEILKAIRFATEKRDSSVLKVTDEPLPRVEGEWQITSL